MPRAVVSPLRSGLLRVFARLYNDEGDIMQPAVKVATTQKVMAQQPAEAPEAPAPEDEAGE